MQTDRHALNIEVSEPEGGTCLVRCAGAIDIENAPQFRETLDRALQPDKRRLILDLRGVTFMDSAGVGVIVGIRDRLQRGVQMLLRTHDTRTRTLLEIAGLGRPSCPGAGTPAPA
ncbi:MAG: STAS domain-containing protein [Armatimonadetes bacterium]|nr:STAS domain-containing protein [Armatimonadota bacterium]